MAYFLLGCKLVAAVLNGVFGAIGVVATFSDPKSSKLSGPGWAAIVFVIALAVVTAVTACVEEYNRRHQEIADLDSRNRILQPFREVTLQYRVLIPDNRRLNDYKDRFDRDVTTFVEQVNGPERTLPGYFEVTKVQDGYDKTYEFNEDCPLFPDKGTEALPYAALGGSAIELQFFKTPIPIESHPSLNTTSRLKPDLVLESGTKVGDEGSHQNLHAEYFVKTQTPFSLRVIMNPSRVRWTTNTPDAFLSVKDLMGAQLFVLLKPGLTPHDADTELHLPEIVQKEQVVSLVVTIDGGREEFFLDNSPFGLNDKDSPFRLKLVSDPEKKQLPLYEYKFPSDPKQFAKRSRD
jgi:hypothetical protein